MTSFFSKISEFFSSLFSSNPEEARKKKALKQIQDEIKQIRPALYKTSTGEILPPFGTALFNLFNLIYPIREIMVKTILHNNSKTARHFRNYLIENSLPGDMTDLRYSISYEGMKDRINNSSAPTRETKYIYDHFREGMNQISKQDEQVVTLEITQFLRLSELCRLDYQTALKKMDPRINLNNPKYKPSFTAVDGRALLPTIMDIYYVLSPLSLGKSIEKHLFLLLEKVTTEGIQEKQKALAKNLTLLRKLIQHQMAPGNLGNLICAIRKDPFFKPPIDTETPQNLVSQYREEMEKEFQKNRAKVEREFNEGVVGTSLKALFGDDKLEKVRAYNEDNARLIENEGHGELIHCRPLAILKTYCLKKYEKEMQPALNKIIVEGFFEDKDYQQALNEAFYHSQECSRRLALFETGLEEKKGASLSTVMTYIDGISQGKDLSASLAQVLENINTRAAEIIEAETNSFYQLGSLVLQMVEDYKSRNPEKISNIKTIGGTGNRELISQVVRGYKDLASFIKLMKNFTMIRSGSQGKQEIPEEA